MYSQFKDFDQHALIASRYDDRSGLSALIAVHNDNQGPAIGGCRVLPYPDHESAITDVLRLSRGMTYKTAISRIPYGGGKAVIIADPRAQKTTELLHAMGDFVQSLGGRYITSFDSGTTLDDVRTIGERTEFVSGTLEKAGDASERTAAGVFHCLQAAAELRYGATSLSGLTVAIQGVGSVGRRLANLVHAAGGALLISDPDEQAVAKLVEEMGATPIATADILEAEADIFAPCALGAILSERTIPRLKARVVVGGANNQLATSADDERLRTADILYCPDYLANAGGIVDLHYQRSGWSQEAVDRHVAGLADTFREVVARSRETGTGTAAITDAIAEERFGREG